MVRYGCCAGAIALVFLMLSVLYSQDLSPIRLLPSNMLVFAPALIGSVALVEFLARAYPDPPRTLVVTGTASLTYLVKGAVALFFDPLVRSDQDGLALYFDVFRGLGFMAIAVGGLFGGIAVKR